jgi:tetratricopeptide (TPR) repeat protein
MKPLVDFKLHVIILMAIASQALAQDKLDSLENILKISDEPSKPSILNELALLNKRDPAKSIQYSEEAIRLSEKYNNEPQLITGWKNLGIAQGFNNQYDHALESLLKSLRLAEKSSEWDLAAEASINIGTIYYVILSNYEKALEFYFKALALYERSNNQKGVASALSGIGIAYTHEKKYSEALETLFKSLKIYQELNDVREIPKLYVNISTCYKEMQDYNKALEFINKAVDGFEASNNDRGKAHALFVIGDIYRITKDHQNAISTLKQGLLLNEQSNHKNSMVDCLILLGQVYLEIGDFTLAERHLLSAIKYSSEINKKESLSKSYQHLANVYEQKKDYQKAFDYLKLHKATYDSLFDAAKSKQIAEMQERFNSESKEKQILLLKQEKAMNQIYLIIATGAVMFLGSIGFLVINRQSLKIKKDREIAEKENQLMEERRTLFETELRNRELTEQQLHSQLEYKNKELATYTLNLIQKNEILENLKESVDEIRSAQDKEIRSKLSTLVNMVNYSFNLDKDWESFKIHFEQVHRNFFRKLLDQYPDLSANDLKLCSLIKLNIDNRGIAAILNISQESAKVARHRLRKKLDLPAEQTLLSFFNSIE